jgi:short-subunit dehydrogenase
MQIDGSVAIVTGASSGIGASVARSLARHRATVVAVARREDRLAETVAGCQADAPESRAYPGDVSSREVCEGIVADTVQRFGRVDILINNAAISPGEDPLHHSVADAERIMAVNFFGPVYLTAAVLPGMAERRHGSVINVTSVSGYIPNPGEPAYGASKAALSRWTHGLAVDLAGTGVHFGVLSPGPIDTEMWSAEAVGYKGKLYSPDFVAQAVVRMIEREITHQTVPRRYGAVGATYPIVGRPMRWGLRRYAASHPPTAGTGRASG